MIQNSETKQYNTEQIKEFPGSNKYISSIFYNVVELTVEQDKLASYTTNINSSK